MKGVTCQEPQGFDTPRQQINQKAEGKRNEATADGSEIRQTHHLRLVVYPHYLHIIYRVLYIPGGAGFLPSTVCTNNFK